MFIPREEEEEHEVFDDWDERDDWSYQGDQIESNFEHTRSMVETLLTLEDVKVEHKDQKPVQILGDLHKK